ncbi:GIY-YIG nuclease family protein [Bacillus thuringiensis]|uniref:GIY-YIG nuclease family protein n=1 Tax=Bacillus thuringiensis TaxID=1428 RepID=UPI00159C0D5C|nr:GIY-YIG nuclease family protein [Bacillus thuringiensis]
MDTSTSAGLSQLLTNSWNNSLSMGLNRSTNHNVQKEGRPSVLTASLLIKDITPFFVWQVDDIVNYSKLPCCYVFRDINGTVLYVGESRTFWERFSQHNYKLHTNTTKVRIRDSSGKKRTFGLYLRFYTVEVYQLDVGDEYNRFFLERCLISMLRPVHNNYTDRVLSGNEYIKILNSSPTRSGWPEIDKVNIKRVINNWPGNEILRRLGIIK